MRHELSHAEYYTNHPYADYCRYFWTTVPSSVEREKFRSFLGIRGYDTSNEELMTNGFQAYLTHTTDRGAFSPGKVCLSQTVLDQLRRKFMAGHPPTRLFGAS